MEQSDISKVFKALSNPQRLRLFEMIYCGFEERSGKGRGKCCCGSFIGAFSAACKKMKLSRSTISHHFKELQNSGLITCTRKGQSFVCEVNTALVDRIRAFLT